MYIKKLITGISIASTVILMIVPCYAKNVITTTWSEEQISSLQEQVSKDKELEEINDGLEQNAENKASVITVTFDFKNQAPDSLVYEITNKESREVYKKEVQYKDDGKKKYFENTFNLPEGDYQITSILQNNGIDNINYVDNSEGDLSFSLNGGAKKININVDIDVVSYYSLDKNGMATYPQTTYGEKITYQIYTTENETTANMSEYWGDETDENGELIYKADEDSFTNTETLNEQESTTQNDTLNNESKRNKNSLIAFFIFFGIAIITGIVLFFIGRKNKK